VNLYSSKYLHFQCPYYLR